MTPRQRHEEGRAAILTAAAHAIARDGYHGMSMRDLSRATGRGLASFYVHFSSKEDILFALQAEAFDALIAESERALALEVDPARRLYAFILCHVRFFAAHPDLMRALVQEAGALPTAKRAIIRARKERYYETASRLIAAVVRLGCGHDGGSERGSQDAAEQERATYALFGMLNWIYGWYEPRRHGSPETLARTLYRIALCGMVNRCPFQMVELDAPPMAAAGGIR